MTKAARIPGVPNAGMAIVMTCFAAFGGFLYGYDTGNISSIKSMNYFLEHYGSRQVAANGDISYFLSSGTDSLITSILSAGTLLGALAGYPLGDYFGRRYGIICFLGLFVIGVAMQTASTSVPLFAAGRVFAGLGVGGTSCLVPMYQSECAPKAIRGAIVSGYQWMITIGLLIASVVTNGTKDINGPACYRIPIALQFIWAAILCAGLIFLPESPRWLIMKGRDEEATKSLSRILAAAPDSQHVNEEFAEIAANLHHERAIGATSYIDCFRNGGPGKNSMRMWTGIGLQSLQQLTGINFIFYFGTQFFTRSGIKDPFITTIATNVVNVGMTVPGIWAVDRLGRRFLLLYGAAGMLISQLIVAIVGITTPSDSAVGGKVLVAFVCIFIGHFAATWGPLAWVVTSEIYPLSIRGKAMSISTASNWLFNLIIAIVTPYMVGTDKGDANMGTNVFFVWGGFCCLCFIFVFFMVPETKGLSLEQVDLLYRNSTILKSNAYRKQILAEDIHDDDHEAYQQPKLRTSAFNDHIEKTKRPLSETEAV